MRLNDERGQIYTMEGIVASIILLSVLLFILEANSIVVPQTERSIDMKLYELAGDTLTCLDRSNNDSWSSFDPLEMTIARWDGSAISSGTGVVSKMGDLNYSIGLMVPEGVRYNVDIIYIDASGNKQDKPVIVHGIPVDNSVVATRLVTLNKDEASDFWKNTVYSSTGFPHVAEVKLTCWYL